jgi:hypothetical protein
MQTDLVVAKSGGIRTAVWSRVLERVEDYTNEVSEAIDA